MALTRCPQCSEEISDKVAVCPRCGYQLHGQAVETAPWKSAGESPQKPAISTGPAKPTSLSAGAEERFRQIYATQGAIEAIKYWREMTGASLAQAKAFYDHEKAAGRLGEPKPRSRGIGCLVTMIVVTSIVALAVAIGVINYSCRQSGGDSSRDSQRQIRSVAHGRQLTSGQQISAC